jgi:Lsr2
MVKRSSVVLTCDLPHLEPVSEGVVTVEFGYEGKTYDVELCPEHADEYHQWMRKYLGHPVDPSPLKARKASGGQARPSVSSGVSGLADTALVRAWARDQGYKVNDRGRISADIVSAYQALHS